MSMQSHQRRSPGLIWSDCFNSRKADASMGGPKARLVGFRQAPHIDCQVSSFFSVPRLLPLGCYRMVETIAG